MDIVFSWFLKHEKFHLCFSNLATPFRVKIPPRLKNLLFYQLQGSPECFLLYIARIFLWKFIAIVSWIKNTIWYQFQSPPGCLPMYFVFALFSKLVAIASRLKNWSASHTPYFFFYKIYSYCFIISKFANVHLGPYIIVPIDISDTGNIDKASQLCTI